MNKKLFIISNESISKNLNNFHCDNLDLKTIPEGLNGTFDVNLIARMSKVGRKHYIKDIKINLATNIFSFIKIILSTINKKENSKYMIISITPYTFLATILLSLFGVNTSVYLRSDGFEEYNSILGKIGKFIYFVMFEITSKISRFISCREHILKTKTGIIVSPSHLNEKWFKNHKEANLKKINLLYVGRIRVEKGIFSLMKIYTNLRKDISLSIVSSSNDHKKITISKNVTLIDTLSEEALIDIYDKNLIFILPSFTEGHPQVLDEALSRLRPVIVFEEIQHVKRNRKGVFICKRDTEDLERTINSILDNFHSIQDEIKKNKLPTNKEFIKELSEILKNEK